MSLCETFYREQNYQGSCAIGEGRHVLRWEFYGSNGDYEATAFEMSANGRDTVWECYVAGISPTNAAAAFRAVISWENGAPEISWEPVLTPEEAAKRTYRKFGKKTLTDPNEYWTEINGDEASYNFFKVSVEMTK